MRKQEFLQGIKDGLPIALGYFSVSMAFGLTVALSGLPIWSAVLISMTNLTSAGQFAGVNILLALGALTELALTTLIINLRYFLMSLSMSQRVEEKMSIWKRMMFSFAITDEVFAVSMQHKGILTSSYMAGLVLTPPIGWTLGTLTGAVLTSFMPPVLSSSMGIALYAMFIAIVIPPAREHKNVMIASLMAALMSVIFYYAPILKSISSGWSIIIITLAVSAAMAFFFPIADEEEGQNE